MEDLEHQGTGLEVWVEIHKPFQLKIWLSLLLGRSGVLTKPRVDDDTNQLQPNPLLMHLLSACGTSLSFRLLEDDRLWWRRAVYQDVYNAPPILLKWTEVLCLMSMKQGHQNEKPTPSTQSLVLVANRGIASAQPVDLSMNVKRCEYPFDKAGVLQDQHVKICFENSENQRLSDWSFHTSSAGLMQEKKISNYFKMTHFI